MNADDIVALEPYDYENKILAQWEDEGVLIVLRADSHKRRLKKDDFVTAIASWKDPAGNSKSFEGPYRIESRTAISLWSRIGGRLGTSMPNRRTRMRFMRLQ